MNLPKEITIQFNEEDISKDFGNAIGCPLYNFLNRTNSIPDLDSVGLYYIYSKNHSTPLYNIPSREWNVPKYRELQKDPSLLKDFKFTITRIN